MKGPRKLLAFKNYSKREDSGWGESSVEMFMHTLTDGIDELYGNNKSIHNNGPSATFKPYNG